MPMTVRDVLELPALQQAGPRVLAGRDRLDAPVRWVHVAEIPEIADLLRGGELVLTTGIGLPPDDDGLRRWIDGLAAVGVAGVVVELGRRFGGTLSIQVWHCRNRRPPPEGWINCAGRDGSGVHNRMGRPRPPVPSGDGANSPVTVRARPE